MARMLKVKIAPYLKQVGAKGALRTELLRRFNARADELDRTMTLMLDEGTVVALVKTTRGRPCTTYYDKETVGDLTAAQEPAMPIEPEQEDAPPQRCTYCRTCGRAIAVPPSGHPYVYCGRACKAGGLTMRAFLAPALSDPRVFSSIAVLLVMADLLMRGFDIARDIFIAGPRILVTDRESGRYLDVVPIGLDGRFPNPQEYEAMAGVYQDGRIVYGGRDCFIATASPSSEEVAAPETVTEGAEIEESEVP